MIKDLKLFKASHGFERVVLLHILTIDGETRKVEQTFDFGKVTAICNNGFATLQVKFPDKRQVTFNLSYVGRQLSWFYHKRPNITHTTFELFQGLSMWWGAVQWLESMKDKEVKK